MPNRTLHVSPERAREMVKEAFEQTDYVKKIKEDGDKIVGITKINITNWGSKIAVEFPKNSTDGETPLMISGRKRFAIDFTANPEEHVERFLFNLDQVAGEQTTTP